MPGGIGYCILCSTNFPESSWNRTKIKGYIQGDAHETYTFPSSCPMYINIKMEMILNVLPGKWAFMWTRSPTQNTTLSGCQIVGDISVSANGVAGALFRTNRALAELLNCMVDLTTHLPDSFPKASFSFFEIE